MCVKRKNLAATEKGKGQRISNLVGVGVGDEGYSSYSVSRIQREGGGTPMVREFFRAESISWGEGRGRRNLTVVSSEESGRRCT